MSTEVSERQRNQVKGSFFEMIVRQLLIKADYSPIIPDGENIRQSDGKIRGRGYWHDIDAYGRYSYPLLYMYPIRLLAEAKCYEDPITLPYIRNFVGALKDIQENYFVQDKMNREEMLAYHRYTDCGSFFSASGFTLGAQKFALAQGVFLISYENNPILEKIIDDMNKLIDLFDIAVASKEKSNFCKWIQRKLNTPLEDVYTDRFIQEQKQTDFREKFTEIHQDLNSIKTSAIAMAVGDNPKFQYPIHMLSYNKLPDETFIDGDELLFRVYFTTTPRGLFFRVIPTESREVELLFSLPRQIYFRYLSEGRMLTLKRKLLSHIELPTTIRGMRRILRLNLDEEWIGRLEERTG